MEGEREDQDNDEKIGSNVGKSIHEYRKGMEDEVRCRVGVGGEGGVQGVEIYMTMEEGWRVKT